MNKLQEFAFTQLTKFVKAIEVLCSLLPEWTVAIAQNLPGISDQVDGEERLSLITLFGRSNTFFEDSRSVDYIRSIGKYAKVFFQNEEAWVRYNMIQAFCAMTPEKIGLIGENV